MKLGKELEHKYTHIFHKKRVCSLTYPVRNVHAPYYNVVCGLSVCLYNIFRRYLINVTIFEKKKLFNIECVF